MFLNFWNMAYKSQYIITTGVVISFGLQKHLEPQFLRFFIHLSVSKYPVILECFCSDCSIWVKSSANLNSIDIVPDLIKCVIHLVNDVLVISKIEFPQVSILVHHHRNFFHASHMTNTSMNLQNWKLMFQAWFYHFQPIFCKLYLYDRFPPILGITYRIQQSVCINQYGLKLHAQMSTKESF